MYGFRAHIAYYLARQGVSRRAIARLLNLDRGTVARLVARAVVTRPVLVLSWCNRCRAWVRWPCLKCRLESEK